MTEADRLMLRARVKKAEGLKLQVYRDSLGYLSIGYGRLIDPTKGAGISKDEAEYMLANDLQRAERQCESLPVYLELSPVRQAVLIEMCFNLGLEGLREFRKMLSALVQRDYDHAASEMLNSQWSAQVKGRAVQLSQQMRTGVWVTT